MRVLPPVPKSTLAAGFIHDSSGVHTGKTMMLAEIRLLLAACPPTATVEEYRAAAVAENALLKNTATTRRETFKRLRQLYALDSTLPVFRAVRRLWDADAASRPVLALLCAAARDPLLRATIAVVLDTPVGGLVTWQQLAGAVEAAYPGRYGQETLDSVGQHAASTWQQAGHLEGKRRKVRARATAGPAATAYAFFLGYLCGDRGTNLFTTLWARLLDAPPGALDAQAFAASQRGWLDYRRIGDIADIGFSFLLEPAGGEGDRG